MNTSTMLLEKDSMKPMTYNSKGMQEETVMKKTEPILGNVYGSLKRSSNDHDNFVYEYFEGSTNKIKHPMKFSALLDLFR